MFKQYNPSGHIICKSQSVKNFKQQTSPVVVFAEVNVIGVM